MISVESPIGGARRIDFVLSISSWHYCRAGASDDRVSSHQRNLIPVTSGASIVLLFGVIGSLIGCGSSNGGGEPARTFFVRSTGSDTQSGTAPERALATIGAAVARASAGDSIVVGPGRYVPSSAGVRAVVDMGANGASAARPLSIIADPTGTLTGDPPGEVIVDAQRELYGFRLTGSSGVVIDGFVITNTRGNNAAGIQVRSSSRDIVVRHCEIRANDGDGIRVEASNGSLLFNNLIHANSLRGIQLSGGSAGSSGTQVINNTIASNGNDGLSIGSATRPVSNTLVRNNLIFDNAQRGIDAERGATLAYDADYNLIFPIQRDGVPVGYGPLTPKGLHDLGVDPLLVAGFRLSHAAAGQPLDSPAIDAGDPNTAARLRSMLQARTTAIDEALDSGIVDIGFHFRPERPPPTPTAPPAETQTAMPPATPPPTNTATPTQGPPSQRLYVRNSGDDTRDGLTPDSALRTIQQAVNNAIPGTEIIVGPGTYTGTVSISGNGSADLPILLRGDSDGSASGDPSGEVVVTSAGGVGVFVDGAQHWTVEGLTITGSAIGIHVRREARSTRVQHNEVYGNTDDGIRIQDTADVTVFNNLIYCNGRRGVLVAGSSSGSTGTALVQNTIVANADRGVFIGTSSVPSVGTWMRNNLIQDNCGNGIQVVDSSLQGYDAQYNLVAPPTYVGATVHPTDTAFDAVTGGAAMRPANFVTRAFCEAVCATPGRDPNTAPTEPTVERHSEDFRLAQTIAGQPPPDSVGVDAGDPALPSEFAVPLRRRTTATNDEPDGGRLDIGYHFPRGEG